MTRYQIGIDIGGTFTDIVVYDNVDKKIFIMKLSTTPKDPSIAVMEAIDKLRLDPKDVLFINHATTIATNALLTRTSLPKTALITNRGFRDVLEIGRQKRAELYNLRYSRPPPLIPRKYRFGIKCRVLSNGSILEDLDLKEIEKLKEIIRREKIVSLAVCFLNSYLNPIHERKVKEFLEKEVKYISISSEVDPNYREFERTSTTVVNAILRPLVSDYLNRLKGEFIKRDITAPLYVMCSNGGLETIEYTSQLPISIIESGPAAGVLASAYLSKILNKDKVITFDMGGTTAKVGSVINNKPDMVNEYEVAGIVHSGRVIKGSGYPVRYSFIDLSEVSAGGGTIAWIDEGGALRVGPKSAGAEPGPVAYNRGGEEPTVTDANIVLGRLNNEFLLGGQMKIYGELSKKAIENRIANRLGISYVEASLGIIRIINNIMSKSISIVSIERGRDPREYSMIAFGGAGPIHACDLAEEIKINEIIVPPHPGLFSAFGLLTVDIIRVFSESVFERNLEEVFIKLKKKAMESYIKEGFNKIEFEDFVDVRYKGQSFELTLKYNDGMNIKEEFDKEHKRIYGYSSKDPIEVVSAKVVAIAKVKKIELLENKQENKEVQKIGYRKVFMNETFIEVPVYARDTIAVGYEDKGPAIIEEYDSTTLIKPGWRWYIDKFSNLVILK